MPDCAGFEPLLVSVKTTVVAAPSAIEAAPKVFATPGAAMLTTRQRSSVVVAPSLIEAAPKVFAAPGVPVVTTRQRSTELFVALVVVTALARLVNAAGLPAQLALACVAWFVSPLTVTVQLAVPPVMAM